MQTKKDKYENLHQIIEKSTAEAVKGIESIKAQNLKFEEEACKIDVRTQHERKRNLEFQLFYKKVEKAKEVLDHEMQVKLLDYTQVKRKWDEKQPTLEHVEKISADLSNKYRLLMDEKRPQIEMNQMLEQKREETENELQTLLAFNEEMNLKIEEQVKKMRGQKDEQRSYHEKVQELEDKLSEREQEQNLVKHRLMEIQEQGNRIKKDQADTLAHRDKLLYTHKQLL